MTSSEKESIGVPGNHRMAYESSLPEILGLPKDEIQTVNTDVSMAVGRVRVTCGRICGLRGEVVAKLNDFDLKLWDNLETYSFALLYANTVWNIARKTIADLDDLTSRRAGNSTHRRQQSNKGRARTQQPSHRARMRCCPSRQCRNNSKKHRSTWRRLMCPRARSRPPTRARLALGFARGANNDEQSGPPLDGACSERPRSAEWQGTNIRYPALRPRNIFLCGELDVPNAVKLFEFGFAQCCGDTTMTDGDIGT